MNQTDVRITTPDAVTPLPGEATAGVTAWQMEKIKTGLRDADAGRFASPADVRSVIQKFIPNGRTALDGHRRPHHDQEAM
ncbi:hypothetical protein [Aureimonas glaciei]|uniref:Uncharacterized protein n=1 Tax=Aureimonas glaciei TaxID=1776957 RepID=A0A916XUS8_9HYPH|nr:hypothetical protein [Aureimonas glaciei]GGD12842.1 hypothetical protein GCM10011335_14610 [Aureimonas glaciei]